MKCNYNGCSSKCKGNIDAESCNVLRAYQQGRADGFQEALTSNGINIYVDKIEADGARKFAEWLCASHIISTPMGTRMWEDNLIAVWQKGAENE